MSFSTQPAVRLTVLVDDTGVWHHKPAVVVVDTEENIQAFLPRLADLGIEGLITLEPVQAVRFGGVRAAAQ